MKKITKTKFYSFAVNLSRNENIYYFEVIAYCISDKTKSSITNLNFIISELISPIIQLDDYETTIAVNKVIGYKIYEKAVELLSDSEWQKQLKIELHNDKIAGKWS